MKKTWSTPSIEALDFNATAYAYGPGAQSDGWIWVPDATVDGKVGGFLPDFLGRYGVDPDPGS